MEKEELNNEELSQKPADEVLTEEETKENLVEKEGDKPFDETIEEARLKIKDDYKKNRTISNVVMFIVVAILVGSFILVLQKGIAFTITGYSLMGATVVFMIVFYFVNKNKLPNKINDYIRLVSSSLNSHTYSDGAYQEVTSDPADRLEMSELIADGVYEGMTNITSRNVVEGMYAGRHFKVGDVALRKIVGRKQEVVFFGKYLSYPNNLHFEGRYVIVSKRKEAETDIPDAVNDLVVLSDEGDFVVYGPKEGSKINKDLNTKFVSMIKEIKVEGELYNLSLVIWAGHSAAYLSYSDAIISLPFENPFNKESFDQYVSQQLQLLNALKSLL